MATIVFLDFVEDVEVAADARGEPLRNEIGVEVARLLLPFPVRQGQGDLLPGKLHLRGELLGRVEALLRGNLLCELLLEAFTSLAFFMSEGIGISASLSEAERENHNIDHRDGRKFVVFLYLSSVPIVSISMLSASSVKMRGAQPQISNR